MNIFEMVTGRVIITIAYCHQIARHVWAFVWYITFDKGQGYAHFHIEYLRNGEK